MRSAMHEFASSSRLPELVAPAEDQSTKPRPNTPSRDRIPPQTVSTRRFVFLHRFAAEPAWRFPQPETSVPRESILLPVGRTENRSNRCIPSSPRLTHRSGKTRVGHNRNPAATRQESLKAGFHTRPEPEPAVLLSPVLRS